MKKLAIIPACCLFTFPLHFIVYNLFYISEGHSRELHEIVASVFFGAQPVCISFPQVGADLILQVKALFKSHSSTREESKSGLLHQILVYLLSMFLSSFPATDRTLNNRDLMSDI